MKTRRLGFFQFILIIAAGFTLIRFLPIIVRATQMLIIGVRAYWWAALPAMICVWVIWKIAKRKRLTRKSEHLFEERPQRDVTHSAEDRSSFL